MAVALVPIGTLEASETPLVEVVKAGAPGLPIEQILPFISMFAVANTALINMLMASRLIYGMAKQHVLPPVLGTVHRRAARRGSRSLFTTTIAFGLIVYVTAFANALGHLDARRHHVAVAARGVRGRQRRRAGAAPRRAGRAVPISRRRRGCPSWGFVASLYLVLPLSGRPLQQYVLAIALVVLGVVLFGVTLAINRAVGIKTTRHRGRREVWTRGRSSPDPVSFSNRACS